MAQRAGRRTCPRCGANNFDTVSHCWKCSAPLSGVPSAPAAAPVPAPAASDPLPAAVPARAAAYAPPLAFADGDPAAARRAAVMLGLVFPWIGLPVGWVFLMLEDGRRQAVGRVCVLWSAIALVLHVLLLYASVAALVPTAMSVLGIKRELSAGTESPPSGGFGGPPGQPFAPGR